MGSQASHPEVLEICIPEQRCELEQDEDLNCVWMPSQRLGCLKSAESLLEWD